MVHERQYRKEALTLLMMSEGWKVMVEHIVTMAGRIDNAYLQPSVSDMTMRYWLGYKKALMDLVDFLAQTAERPNPFEEHRMAFLGSLKPQEHAEETVKPPEASAPVPVRPRRRTSPGGIA